MSSIRIRNCQTVSTSLIRHASWRSTNRTAQWHARNSTLLLKLRVRHFVAVSNIILFGSQTRTYAENFLLRRSTCTIRLLSFSVLFVLHLVVLIFIFLNHVFTFIHVGISFILLSILSIISSLSYMSSYTRRCYRRSRPHDCSTIVLQGSVIGSVVILIHRSRRSMVHLPMKRW